MANIKQSLTHSAASAKKLAITIPSTVTRNEVSCDEAGDVYAQRIYGSNGNYASLAATFTKIANLCDKALRNKAFVSTGTKSDLQQAKKKANAQAAGCKKRMAEIKAAYNATSDISSEINKFISQYINK